MATTSPLGLRAHTPRDQLPWRGAEPCQPPRGQREVGAAARERPRRESRPAPGTALSLPGAPTGCSDRTPSVPGRGFFSCESIKLAGREEGVVGLGYRLLTPTLKWLCFFFLFCLKLNAFTSETFSLLPFANSPKIL